MFQQTDIAVLIYDYIDIYKHIHSAWACSRVFEKNNYDKV